MKILTYMKIPFLNKNITIDTPQRLKQSGALTLNPLLSPLASNPKTINDLHLKLLKPNPSRFNHESSNHESSNHQS